MKKDLIDNIHKILKGIKPTEHAKQHIDVANRKLGSKDLHKSYDVSGDMDPEKELEGPGVKLDRDNDIDDLEYVKHKMGMDKPGEVHVSDEEKDTAEREPAKAMSADRVSFSDYVKGDNLRRYYLRMAKINKVQQNEEYDVESAFISYSDILSKLETMGESKDDFEITDKDIDNIVSDFDENDAMELYHPDEVAVVDKDSGEPIDEVDDADDEDTDELKEDFLLEVLSREGRLKRKLMFARTKSKRKRALMLALHKASSNKVIAKRARVAAVKAIRNKMLRGRDYNTLSQQEKAALESKIEKLNRSGDVSRLAMKLAPKIRKIEKERLTHSSYTKE